jgi:hypothetical protein
MLDLRFSQRYDKQNLLKCDTVRSDISSPSGRRAREDPSSDKVGAFPRSSTRCAGCRVEGYGTGRRVPSEYRTQHFPIERYRCANPAHHWGRCLCSSFSRFGGNVAQFIFHEPPPPEILRILMSKAGAHGNKIQENL